MLKQRTFLLLGIAFILFAVPASIYAQDDYYGRGRRDERRDWSHDRRSLIKSAERIDKLSGQLKGDLDDALDRSRLNGKNREDRVNELAHDFHSAAAQFKDKLDDGRNLDRAEEEARRVLDLGWQLDRIISRNDFGEKVESKWSSIRDGLRVIENAYGYR